jgi:hypothetical protein
MNQRELLTVVEDSWRQLDAAIDGLDEKTMVEPGVVEEWSVKDLLGHVVAWEQVALKRVDRWRKGEGFDDLIGGSVDVFNAAESARRRQMFLNEIRDEMAESRRQLRALLESLSDDEWNVVITSGDRSETLGAWVGGDLYGEGPGNHAAEHAGHIRAWRSAQGR